MGFLDDTVNEFENLVKEHPDQARGALDQAEQYVEEKTGGQYDSQIQAGRDQAESFLGIQEQGGQDGQSQSSDQQPAN